MVKMAKAAVWLDNEASERRWRYGRNVFEYYLEEILSHAGVPFERIGHAEDLYVINPDIVLIGLSGEDDTVLNRIESYVQNGGTVIAYGGLNRLAGRLGCRVDRFKEAVYAELPLMDKADEGERLRALGATAWRPMVDQLEFVQKGQLHKLSQDGELLAAAYIEFRIGSGKLIRWNVNIPETICLMQQGGGPVTEDGLTAPDASGNLDEGILKADDWIEFDWGLDRERSDKGNPYFAIPHADLWREVLIGQLLGEAASLRLSLPFVDYWPDGVEHVATISHDSDSNVDESAEVTLNLLKECGIQSTWCMIEPGYSQAIYEQVSDDGHELAFHYNALAWDNGFWDANEFTRQLEFIRRSTGADIVTNKNHYTRFEGWGELFDWCEKNGIEADQTRGPSKRGNIGFLFGTCHPYYPIADAEQSNRMYNVLEIGFLTQDLEHPGLADSSVIEPFLKGVSRVRGVAHFLFHQIHFLNLPEVREALRKVVESAKQNHFVFWTSERILRWEQAKRRVKISLDDQSNVIAQDAPEGLVVWIPVIGQESEHEEIESRFGIRCRKQTMNMQYT